MKLKQLSTLVNKGSHLAREGLEYVNKHISDITNIPATSVTANNVAVVTTDKSKGLYIDDPALQGYDDISSTLDALSPNGRIWVFYWVQKVSCPICPKSNGLCVSYMNYKGGNPCQDYFSNWSTDSIEPSVFLLPVDLPTDRMTLGAIKHFLPINQFEKYTKLSDGGSSNWYRFKTTCNESNNPFDYVWLDIMHDDDYIPLYENAVHVKVLRVPGYAIQTNQRHNVVKKKFRNNKDTDIVDHIKLPGDTSETTKFQPNDIGIDCYAKPPRRHKKDSSHASSSGITAASQVNSNLGTLTGFTSSRCFGDDSNFDVRAGPITPRRRKTKASISKTCIDPFETAATLHKTSNPFVSESCGEDLLTFTGASNRSPDDLPSRDELVRRRLEKRSKRMEELKAEVKVRRDEARRHINAKLEASETLKESIDKWAFNQDGSYKDVRALLSTLQDILWSSNDFNVSSLSLLMVNPNEVKKSYRQALLICHPDKHQNASPEQQYRADRIFQALNESFKLSTQLQSPPTPQ